MGSYNVHGEIVTDGNGILTDIVLYDAGSPDTVRTLTDSERLHVTDVIIIQADQSSSDMQLVSDTVAAGRQMINSHLETGRPISIHFRTPYICAKATGLAFLGPQYGKTSCIIQGFIRET